MTAQSGLGFSGIVAIQIPAGGDPGQVLTKVTADNYDYEWAAGGGGGGGGVVTSMSLTGLLSTVLNVFQDAGVSPIQLDLAPMFVFKDLQGTYALDTSVPQITIAVGFPLTIDTIAGGTIFQVRDLFDFALLDVSSTGSTLTGSNIASGELELRGSNDVNLGVVRSFSPIIIESVADAAALSGYAVQYSPTQVFNAGYVGGGYNTSPNITFNNSFFIWEGLRGAPNILSGTPPTFAAFTLFQALPVLRTVGTNSPLNALVVNAGVQQSQEGVGVIATATNSVGMNFVPHSRAIGAFGTMNVTNLTGLLCSPVYSGGATTAVNMGTVSAIVCQEPIVALFQAPPGTVTITAYNGILFPNTTFGGAAAVVNVINTTLTAGTNKRVINSTGNAVSTHNGPIRFEADLAGPIMGIDQDVSMFWAGAGFFGMQFNSAGGAIGFDDQLRISNPVNNTIDLQGNAAATILDINMDMQHSGVNLGFYGTAPVAQPAAPVTLADVIAALQTLGLTA